MMQENAESLYFKRAFGSSRLVEGFLVDMMGGKSIWQHEERY